MNASTDTDTLSSNAYNASREASADLRRRSASVKGAATEEMRAFLSDVDDLIKRVANVNDGDVAEVRVKVANALGDIRRRTADTADSLRARARVAAGNADDYVRDRPWTAVGLAAAAGLIVGVGVTAAAAVRR